MSAAFTLLFDQIATVTVGAVRQSGQLTNVPAGSTIASDNAAVAVATTLDPTGTFIISYMATATAQTGSANITLSPPSGSTIPADVAVCTIAADPVTSLVQNTGSATFAPNPTPPTA